MVLHVHDPVAVFPARAGMSRPTNDHTAHAPRFPRTRGDEPYPELLVTTPHVFSPHARG